MGTCAKCLRTASAACAGGSDPVGCGEFKCGGGGWGERAGKSSHGNKRGKSGKVSLVQSHILIVRFDVWAFFFWLVVTYYYL